MRHDGRHNPFGNDADWIRAARGGPSWAASLFMVGAYMTALIGLGNVAWNAAQPMLHALSSLPIIH